MTNTRHWTLGELPGPRGSQARTGHEPPRVLLVDDDERLLVAVRRGLSLRGFDVGLARDSGQALGYLQGRWPQVLLLDISMPGMDGLSLCRLVRQSSNLPILMLTARDSVADRVAGLQAGADDYIVKPFALDELVARIEAVLRRARPHELEVEAIKFADILMDRKSWLVKRAGRPLSLTATEFRLLEQFMRFPGRVLTREDILTSLWGEECPQESNVVDVHIANLRKKLEEGGRPRLIQTVRAVGYTLKQD